MNHTWRGVTTHQKAIRVTLSNGWMRIMKTYGR